MEDYDKKPRGAENAGTQGSPDNVGGVFTQPCTIGQQWKIVGCVEGRPRGAAQGRPVGGPADPGVARGRPMRPMGGPWSIQGQPVDGMWAHHGRTISAPWSDRAHLKSCQN